MGRAEPEVVTVPPTVESLVELSRSGRHAASDHLETAALVGVADRWLSALRRRARRCASATSNVGDGARVAVGLDPDLVVFDGSGAALPPIAADRTVVVVGGHQDPAVVGGYLNTYRLLLADLVVVTMAEPGSGWEDGSAAAWPSPCAADVAVVATTLRPRPLADVAGRSVAYFCAAPPAAHGRLREHLEAAHGAGIVHVSGNLANRAALREELVDVDADVFLVELKAAAIDVVAEAALAQGAEIVLAANDVVPLASEPDLDELLLDMAKFTS